MRWVSYVCLCINVPIREPKLVTNYGLCRCRTRNIKMPTSRKCSLKYVRFVGENPHENLACVFDTYFCEPQCAFDFHFNSIFPLRRPATACSWKQCEQIHLLNSHTNDTYTKFNLHQESSAARRFLTLTLRIVQSHSHTQTQIPNGEKDQTIGIIGTGGM